MADKGRPVMRRKEKKNNEPTEIKKEVKNGGNNDEADASAAEAVAPNDAGQNGRNGDFQVEPMELPPFEIITGDRIDPLVFQFQFKNVEYSSGRNKTFLCYLVDTGKADEGLQRGYLEDEHTGSHAEEAFFTQCLPHYDPALKYSVTWYMSSSPCCACAAKMAEALKARRNIKLSIFAARLFEWEEAEIQAGLKALHIAGCKIRVMKPLDFSYTWDTFVENEDQPLNLWADCKENYEYYHERLADILQ
ncbi:C-_U-editing enzyme APOBEC-2a [Takifugu rubripes]|uniref:Apolipoprotein B mRNA editing enzyme, catalytic polypeptide-like 2a n=1 Tax=Takifugu rubripes TaxID=31033 RepID=H2TE47_TAKRU|nr:C->U-editing enzyme APOBEC-2-like [Takifugu rubripes]|eukprot:XP_011611927.1 PREDICTED: probable C-_U-editing enzyme APOBEC-2 [Takifugu rubripes]